MGEEDTKPTAVETGINPHSNVEYASMYATWLRDLDAQAFELKMFQLTRQSKDEDPALRKQPNPVGVEAEGWIPDPSGQYVDHPTGRKFLNYAQRRAQINEGKRLIYDEMSPGMRELVDDALKKTQD